MRTKRPAEGRGIELPRFDWMMIPCSSREAAEAEARLQQGADTPDAEWIYLQTGKQWVARRTPVDPDSVQRPPRIPGAGEPRWKTMGWWLVEALFSR